MKNLFATSSILFLSIPLFAQAPDTLWTKTLGGGGFDEGYSVQETAGGGYIITGETSSFGVSGSDVRLIKTSVSGDALAFIFLHPTISKVQGQAQSQEATPPCLRPEHKQIAFLKGDWDVLSRQRVNFTENRWRESTGKASWSPILGGCALREEWSGKIDGEPMRWIQILTYNYREKKWELVMIDWTHGNLITSEGFYKEGKLIFTSPQMRSGKLLIDRTTFEDVDSDSFLWSMETSLDGGESWITFWEMSYTRQ